MNRPGLLLRVFAFLVFPFSAKGSAVWWWRMHEGYLCSEGCPWGPKR